MQLLDVIDSMKEEALTNPGGVVEHSGVCWLDETDWHDVRVIRFDGNRVAFESNRVSLERVDPGFALSILRTEDGSFIVQINSRVIQTSMGRPYEVLIKESSGVSFYSEAFAQRSSTVGGLYEPGTLGDAIVGAFGSSEIIQILQKLEEFIK